MSSEWFSFTTGTGQLLLPMTIHGNKDGITGEDLRLLVPACPATVHFPAGFCQMVL